MLISHSVFTPTLFSAGVWTGKNRWKHPCWFTFGWRGFICVQDLYLYCCRCHSVHHRKDSSRVMYRIITPCIERRLYMFSSRWLCGFFWKINEVEIKTQCTNTNTAIEKKTQPQQLVFGQEKEMNFKTDSLVMNQMCLWLQKVTLWIVNICFNIRSLKVIWTCLKAVARGGFRDHHFVHILSGFVIFQGH